jgi:hypothetical protein
MAVTTAIQPVTCTTCIPCTNMLHAAQVAVKHMFQKLYPRALLPCWYATLQAITCMLTATLGVE